MAVVASWSEVGSNGLVPRFEPDPPVQLVRDVVPSNHQRPDAVTVVRCSAGRTRCARRISGATSRYRGGALLVRARGRAGGGAGRELVAGFALCHRIQVVPGGYPVRGGSA